MSHITCSTLPPLKAVDGLVHVEHRQYAGVEVGIRHAGLLAADAEESVASPGNDDDARTGLATDIVDAVADFVAHRFIEHVAVVGTIQRDSADRAVLGVDDGFELACHGVSLLVRMGNNGCSSA